MTVEELLIGGSGRSILDTSRVRNTCVTRTEKENQSDGDSTTQASLLTTGDENPGPTTWQVAVRVANAIVGWPSGNAGKAFS